MRSAEELAKAIIQHEGLIPHQTPFRVTHPSMRKWTSMFDDTLKVPLNPNFEAPENRRNFLYLQNEEDIVPAVQEQLRRYYSRNPNISVEEAMRTFDHTGADGKLNYLNKSGFNTSGQLREYFGQMN